MSRALDCPEPDPGEIVCDECCRPHAPTGPDDTLCTACSDRRAPPVSAETQRDLDALAVAVSLELWFEQMADYDPGVIAWAVWGEDPGDDVGSDIIATGNTPEDALAGARQQLAEWEVS